MQNHQLDTYDFSLLYFKKPWKNVYLANKEGNECTQISNLMKPKVKGDEDCLFLNVYTPKIENRHIKLPLMFWIHGGAFYFGSGSRDSYCPDYLIEKNVIVVTINYRLGALGFLSTNTSNAPGNIGIKDAILALKWINDNVESFGGDPSKITIFGQSSGAVMAHFMILSPLTKGLFHAAILESGTALTRWGVSYNHKYVARKLAKSLGIKDRNVTTMIQKLQEKNASEIVKKSLSLKFVINLRINLMNYSPWNPCIEYKHPQAVITDLPYELLLNEKFNKVPIIFGYNSREGLMVYPIAIHKELRNTATLMGFIPPGLAINLNKKAKEQINNKIRRKYYPKCLFPGFNPFIDLMSVTNFINPIHQSAWLHSNTSNKNIYLYKFGYQGNLSYRAIMKLDELGINGDPHVEEVPYIWRPIANYQNTSAEDSLTRERLITLFTNFAKNLNPNSLPNVMSNIWKPLGIEHNFLNITTKLIPDRKPNWDDIEFWNTLYDQYGKPPFINY